MRRSAVTLTALLVLLATVIFLARQSNDAPSEDVLSFRREYNNVSYRRAATKQGSTQPREGFSDQTKLTKLWKGNEGWNAWNNFRSKLCDSVGEISDEEVERVMSEPTTPTKAKVALALCGKIRMSDICSPDEIASYGKDILPLLLIDTSLPSEVKQQIEDKWLSIDDSPSAVLYSRLKTLSKGVQINSLSDQIDRTDDLQTSARDAIRTLYIDCLKRDKDMAAAYSYYFSDDPISVLAQSIRLDQLIAASRKSGLGQQIDANPVFREELLSVIADCASSPQIGPDQYMIYRKFQADILASQPSDKESELLSVQSDDNYLASARAFPEIRSMLSGEDAMALEKQESEFGVIAATTWFMENFPEKAQQLTTRYTSIPSR